MGCECSCFRTNPDDQLECGIFNKKVPESTTNNVQEDSLDISQPFISPQNQIHLQSVCRGFLTRLALVQQLDMFRYYKKNRYKKVDLKVQKKYLNKEKLKKLQKEFGALKFKRVKDGVEKQAWGTFQVQEGVFYEGEWNNRGQKHGIGCQIRPDGTFFKGNYQYGKIQGFGLLVYSNGDIATANFKQGKLSGTGKFLSQKGMIFEGNFKNDFKHGFGRQKYPDGSVYQGNFRHGRKHGQGKFEWADGSYYQGEFKRNQFHGKGFLKQTDGNEYSGDWVKNKKHGNGIFKWKDGREYRGNYVQDKKEGTGSLYYTDGREYHGEWKEGKQHGRGRMVLMTAGKRIEKEGNWKRGSRLSWG